MQGRDESLDDLNCHFGEVLACLHRICYPPKEPSNPSYSAHPYPDTTLQLFAMPAAALPLLAEWVSSSWERPGESSYFGLITSLTPGRERD